MKDAVFKALADPVRRKILDRLSRRDGQTLGELCERVEMTRFGVMKHLKVLEAARLVTTRRKGREKFHYLNAVPIRLIHDRWVSRFALPIVAAMSDLKTRLEDPMTQNPNQQIYEVFIRTTPEKLWQGITDPAFTSRYFFGTSIKSTFKKGAPFLYTMPDGSTAVNGEILESDPPNKLVMTWSFQYDPALAGERSKITWLIEKRGAACKLTAIHDLPEAPNTAKHVSKDGWTVVLSGLKTLLETGEPLALAAM